MTTFETIWNRIKANEGETFTQIRGGEFTYEVVGNMLIPDRTNQNFPRIQFKERNLGGLAPESRYRCQKFRLTGGQSSRR